MPRMTADQMQLGDVLLLKDIGETTHRFIAAAQAVLSHGWNRSSSITHAGLYGTANTILEASGSGHGLQAKSLDEKPGHYHFEVYRWRDAELAYRAAYWAEVLISQREHMPGFGGYSKSGAASSLFRSSDAKSGAQAQNRALQNALLTFDIDAMQGQRDYYCSGFVVECYVMATSAGAKPPIDLDYRFVSPKRLHGELNKGGRGWSHPGHIIAGQM